MFPDIRESLSNALWARLCGHGFLVEAVKPFPSGEILTHFHRKKKKKKKKTGFAWSLDLKVRVLELRRNGLFVDSGFPCQEPIAKE